MSSKQEKRYPCPTGGIVKSEKIGYAVTVLDGVVQKSKSINGSKRVEGYKLVMRYFRILATP